MEASFRGDQMRSGRESRPGGVHLIALFVLFLTCGISLPSLSGLLVFPFSLVPPEWDLVYRAAITIAFLSAAVVTWKNERYQRYGKIFLAFFIAACAINVQALSANINIQTTPINGIVLSMFFSTLLVVFSIVVLALVSGDRLPDIYVKKGNLKSGLAIGLLGFFTFAIFSIPIASLLFNGQNLSVDRVISWSPWILVIVVCNGMREELLYRGLFLKKYMSVFGPGISNLLQALIFSLSHTVAGRGSVPYTSFTVAFVLITFLLGIILGYLMRKTDGIVGPILFHAGSDIPVFLGIISNL